MIKRLDDKEIIMNLQVALAEKTAENLSLRKEVDELNEKLDDMMMNLEDIMI